MPNDRAVVPPCPGIRRTLAARKGFQKPGGLSNGQPGVPIPVHNPMRPGNNLVGNFLCDRAGACTRIRLHNWTFPPYEAQNIAVSGAGVLDGQAANGNW